MLKHKKILFPINLSEVSEKTVPYVTEFTKNLNTEIHLLYVVEKTRNLSTIYTDGPAITSLEKDLCQIAEKSLLEFRKLYFVDFPNTKAKVITGHATEEILKYAESQKIDLIIMGSHCKSSIEKMVFGLVVDQVVKMSPVPVTVVNPDKAIQSK